MCIIFSIQSNPILINVCNLHGISTGLRHRAERDGQYVGGRSPGHQAHCTRNFAPRVLTYWKRGPTQTPVHRPAVSASPRQAPDRNAESQPTPDLLRVCILERFLGPSYAPYSLRGTGVQNSEKERNNPLGIWEGVGVSRHGAELGGCPDTDNYVGNFELTVSMDVDKVSSKICVSNLNAFPLSFSSLSLASSTPSLPLPLSGTV